MEFKRSESDNKKYVWNSQYREEHRKQKMYMISKSVAVIPRDKTASS